MRKKKEEGWTQDEAKKKGLNRAYLVGTHNSVLQEPIASTWGRRDLRLIEDGRKKGET